MLVWSVKHYTIETFKETLKKKKDYLNFVNSGFTVKVMRGIDSVTPTKKVTVKANLKLWFDSKIVSAVPKRGKLYSRYKKSD